MLAFYVGYFYAACAVVNGCAIPFCYSWTFQSCLYGSEPQPLQRGSLVIFLSCLYGSEQFTFCRVPDVVLSKLPVRQ